MSTLSPVAALAPSEEERSASQLGWYDLGAVPHGVGLTGPPADDET